jgi:transposase
VARHDVGLRVSLETTPACVSDETGAVLWRGKVASAPEALSMAVRARAPQVERIGLETSPLCIRH